MKNLLVNIAIVFLTVSLSIVAAEFALRFTEYERVLRFHEHNLSQYYYEKDSLLGADIAKNFATGFHIFSDGAYPIFSNSFGCFDRNRKVENNYILLVGDSMTWGFTRYEKKWGTILEKLLGHQILKCGVPKTGTLFQLQKAKKIIAQVGHAPSAIIVGYSSNDFNDDAVFPDESVINGYRVSRIKSLNIDNGEIDYFEDEELKKRVINFSQNEIIDYVKRGNIKDLLKHTSIIANLVWAYVKPGHFRPFSRTGGKVRRIYDVDLRRLREKRVEWAEIAWRKHLDAILDFQKFAAGLGAEAIFVLFPEREDTQGEHKSKDTLEFLREMGIRHVNVNQDVQKSLGAEKRRALYWRFDTHLNETGNEFVGIVVANFLVKNGIAPCKPEARCQR